MSKSQVGESKTQQATDSSSQHSLSIEEQGIDTISESERKGTPVSLFWPWFAANI
ncbi:hypothetical protein [Gardnerella swidsinskii]|nr:hypothetical protein [Gardnerella swidsinskii]